MGPKPKIKVRASSQRGSTEFQWLESRHTFSFGEFYDPAHMGFRSLRVINDDRIAPGKGFGMHGHHDMEILTVVLSGVLEHQDSLGNRERLHPGEVQVMTAGRGIRHSEVNPSTTEECHLLQIWIEPAARGLAPCYGQKHFQKQHQDSELIMAVGGLCDLSAPLRINQDARLLIGELRNGAKVSYDLTPGRAAWIHVACGAIHLSEHSLGAGDSCSVENQSSVEFVTTEETKVLVFDLA